MSLRTLPSSPVFDRPAEGGRSYIELFWFDMESRLRTKRVPVGFTERQRIEAVLEHCYELAGVPYGR